VSQRKRVFGFGSLVVIEVDGFVYHPGGLFFEGVFGVFGDIGRYFGPLEMGGRGRWDGFWFLGWGIYGG
jgi:hypothetical protein